MNSIYSGLSEVQVHLIIKWTETVPTTYLPAHEAGSILILFALTIEHKAYCIFNIGHKAY